MASGHFFQCIFLGVVYVFLQRRQRVDECDGTAGFKVDAGVITSAAVADVLTFLEAVRFQQGVYGRHVVFAPYVHLNVVDFVYNAVADVQIFFPLIQQFIKCFQFLVMRREYLFSGTFVYAVCQYQFQNLWQTCEVDTGAAK